MTKEEGLLMAVFLGGIAIALFYLYTRLENIQDRLDRLGSESAHERFFRQEHVKRLELESRLNLLQEHLGLMTVVQPQHTILVKKENAS